jgi:hypothetical protein
MSDVGYAKQHTGEQAAASVSGCVFANMINWEIPVVSGALLDVACLLALSLLTPKT